MSELKLKTTRNNLNDLRQYATTGSTVADLAEDLDTCLAEIERLRGVLSWYAFTGNDLTEQTADDIWDNPYVLAHQLYLYGQRAREALK